MGDITQAVIGGALSGTLVTAVGQVVVGFMRDRREAKSDPLVRAGLEAKNVETAVATMNTALQAAERRASALDSEVARLNGRLADVASNLADTQSRLIDAEQRATKARADCTTLQHTADDLAAQLETAKRRIYKLVGQLREAGVTGPLLPDDGL